MVETKSRIADAVAEVNVWCDVAPTRARVVSHMEEPSHIPTEGISHGDEIGVIAGGCKADRETPACAPIMSDINKQISRTYSSAHPDRQDRSRSNQRKLVQW